MAFIRWRKNKAYIVHNMRKNGKVKQLILAYLGVNPKITDDTINRVEKNYPDIIIDWDNLKQSLFNKSNIATTVATTPRQDLVIYRPMIWAYFEALRKNQIEPGVTGDVAIWNRKNEPLPHRRPSYSEKIAHEELWPLFLCEIEKFNLSYWGFFLVNYQSD